MSELADVLKTLQQKRAELTSRGHMSDPGRQDVQLLKLAEKLAEITKKQQREIRKLERENRKLLKLQHEKEVKAVAEKEEKPKGKRPGPGGIKVSPERDISGQVPMGIDKDVPRTGKPIEPGHTIPPEVKKATKKAQEES